MPSIKPFDDGGFATKIIQLTQYDIGLLGKLGTRKNISLIEEGAGKILINYFEHYIDAIARSNRLRFHHVYEFDQTGDKKARLFKGQVTPSTQGTKISFSFTPAKKPNRFGYKFSNKAQVMEDGKTVIVRPKRSTYLVYVLDDGRFVKTSKPSVIKNPGGDEVKGALASEFRHFTATQARRVLDEYLFFERINDNIKRKRRIVIPRINNTTLTNAAQQAAMDAHEIALGVRNSSVN